jgi:hypothetical protein
MPINEFEKRLTESNPGERALAAEEIGDLLENADLPLANVETLARRLIEAAATEADEEARWAMLDALSKAGSRRASPISGPWVKLVAALGAFDPQSLIYALSALGFTRDLSLADWIRPYLAHQDSDVREAARDALVELGVPLRA